MQLFANNPDLYYEIYKEETREEIEQEVDWMRPSSPQDVEQMLKLLEEAP